MGCFHCIWQRSTVFQTVVESYFLMVRICWSRLAVILNLFATFFTFLLLQQLNMFRLLSDVVCFVSFRPVLHHVLSNATTWVWYKHCGWLWKDLPTCSCLWRVSSRMHTHKFLCLSLFHYVFIYTQLSWLNVKYLAFVCLFTDHCTALFSCLMTFINIVWMERFPGLNFVDILGRSFAFVKIIFFHIFGGF